MPWLAHWGPPARTETGIEVPLLCNLSEAPLGVFGDGVGGWGVCPLLDSRLATIINSQHKSSCHRLCYDSVQALRQAYETQGAEQTRLVKVAEQKMKQAWVTGDAGVKLHNQIWAAMTI